MSYLQHIQPLQHVHELVIIEANRRACQYFLNLLSEAYQQAVASPYFLLDMRQSGLLPLSYLASELRQLLNFYPQHPTTHLALVIDNPQLLKMAQNLLGCLLRCEDVQYFTEIEEARTWMRQAG